VRGLHFHLEVMRRCQHWLGAFGGLSDGGEVEGEGERVVIEGATVDAPVHPRCSLPGPQRLTSNRWRLGFGKLLDRKVARGMDVGTPNLVSRWCGIEDADTRVGRVIWQGKGREAGLNHQRERGGG
jgi:hypothetical protein